MTASDLAHQGDVCVGEAECEEQSRGFMAETETGWPQKACKEQASSQDSQRTEEKKKKKKILGQRLYLTF